VNINDATYKKEGDTITIEEYNSLVDKYMKLCELLNNTNGNVEYLRTQIEEFRRLIHGAKSERFIPTPEVIQQLNIPFDDEIQELQPEVETVDIQYKKAKKKPVRKPLSSIIPAHIKRVREVIEPDFIPENSKKIGEEVSEFLEYNPAQPFVRVIVRPIYKVVETEEIIVAQYVGSPIVASNFAASMLSYLMVSKFVDHLPFYRLSQMFKRDDITLSESTINDQLTNVCKLLSPLYEVLKISTLASEYLQTDETIIKVQTSAKKGKTHTGYFWSYHSPTDRLVFFDYCEGRGKMYPEKMLEFYIGSIQTDAYGGYNQFDENPNMITLACMAHLRRKFEHALSNNKHLAQKFLVLIQKLYKIEHEARDGQMSTDERYKLRQEMSKPVLGKIEELLNENAASVLPKSPMGKAIAYALNVWPKIMRYIDNGIYEIDNNLIENSIRPIAIGRKNYLFAGSHEGAKRAAMMYSLFGTCKMHNVNPMKWLTDVLTRIPKMKPSELKELLPQNWKNNQQSEN
jgi:transposase